MSTESHWVSDVYLYGIFETSRYWGRVVAKIKVIKGFREEVY